MRFVIVSGMSGAGKSIALKMLEDAGYFCVDNLPLQLLQEFARIASDTKTDVDQVAVSVDIRSGQNLSRLTDELKQLDERKFPYEILFLDADNVTLIKRYKETRRSHPLVKDGRVETGIIKEREMIRFIKERADYIIDTTKLLTRELKAELDKIFVKNEAYSNFNITLLSFGFKYGIPNDADLVFDVRFLPNPYYLPELRSLTGNDQQIQDYVMNCKEAGEFLNKLYDLLAFLIPNYIKEGKYRLVIGVGCTGGKHRSVTIANQLYQQLLELPYSLRCEHRDIEKDAVTKAL
ncbi:MAG: RNase adapter RapZ [Lachnospiraceae bacterium]|nr:RNase adapter RapZ [Lachnospiraceae bacterium]